MVPAFFVAPNHNGMQRQDLAVQNTRLPTISYLGRLPDWERGLGQGFMLHVHPPLSHTQRLRRGVSGLYISFGLG